MNCPSSDRRSSSSPVLSAPTIVVSFLLLLLLKLSVSPRRRPFRRPCRLSLVFENLLHSRPPRPKRRRLFRRRRFPVRGPDRDVVVVVRKDDGVALKVESGVF